MKPGWFDRKTHATLQGASRDVQFKAQLLSAMPEDSSEVFSVIEVGRASTVAEKST
jgi:hypothetical protein